MTAAGRERSSFTKSVVPGKLTTLLYKSAHQIISVQQISVGGGHFFVPGCRELK